MESIVDELIIKDEDGAVYMPEFTNGIGNFNQGIGYQVKILSSRFHVCSNNEEFRLEQNNHAQIAQNTKRLLS